MARGLKQATLAQVAEEASQNWINEYPGDDSGHEMRAAVDKAVKEAKDRLQTKFNREQAVANPIHGKGFQNEVNTLELINQVIL